MNGWCDRFWNRDISMEMEIGKGREGTAGEIYKIGLDFRFRCVNG